MGKRLVVALGIAGVGLAVASLLGPWWVVVDQGVGIMPIGGTTSYSPFALSLRMSSGMTSVSSYSGWPNVGEVFLVAAVLTAVGIAAGAGMACLTWMRAATPRMRRWRARLGYVAFQMTVAAPLWVLFRLPWAVGQDVVGYYPPSSGFWGSAVTGGTLLSRTEFTWGPGWAWYLPLVASALFLAATVHVFRAGVPLLEETAPASAAGQ